MKDLKPTKAIMLLDRLVAEGEHEQQDFKLTVNDAEKIARTLSAFANNRGGRLLIGVDDNKSIKGIRSEEDIFVVERAASLCNPECEVEFKAYKYRGGAVVIAAMVDRSDRRPVYVRENDGQRAYIRVADENIVAPPLMEEMWKLTDDPDRSVVFDADAGVTEILRYLENTMATPDELLRRVKVSQKVFERKIVELLALDVVEFVFYDRNFRLRLKN